MNAESMGLDVITAAISGIGAVYADRLELNRQKSTTGSSSGEVLVESSV
jgi:hypothetical protein